MPTTGTVHAERFADCPFSVAQDYAEEHLHEAERGGETAVVRAGPLRRRVRFSFGIRSDSAESGRPHEELALCWSAGTRWLPDFSGTLRMRIASPGTMLVLDGRYAPPGGALGGVFDRLFGHRIARATAGALLDAIAATLNARERAWRAAARDGS